MNPLKLVRSRFTQPLSELVDDPAPLLAMIRPAQDTKFGDYQANCAMPLAKQLGKPPREVAEELIKRVELNDFCDRVEVAGPGFINITLSDQWLSDRLKIALVDERLGVPETDSPLKYVIDYSSPNVAKPMHVGHIRSTVIGDSLAKILRFLGHQVITDNHLGDWGTQFGMIIYGYKNFVDADAYQNRPVQELSRLYRVVRVLMDYQDAITNLPKSVQLIKKQREKTDELAKIVDSDDKAASKKAKKELKRLKAKIQEEQDRVESLKQLIEQVESDQQLSALAQQHNHINKAVLLETAKLHDGDRANVALWNEFLPLCRADIQRVYQRLNIEFDHEHGESFYHDQLADVVADFQASGVAQESDGAICIFLDNYDAPMLIQKSDGAYLYATSDLATIKYRMETWNPDVILYVVDFRQHEHFAKLFDVARAWKYPNVDYRHVSFGTVMGDDGKPFKTRSGDTVGLEGLLDEAEERAFRVVSEAYSDRPTQKGNADELKLIASTVGLGALKYADLSQNRSSDYIFSYDKMLQLNGNTATYLQYGYARVNGIFRKGDVDFESIREHPVDFRFDDPVERRLAVELIRFEEALADVIVDYRPNLLANYLFDLVQGFYEFFDKCPVLKLDDADLKKSRLQFCDLVARTIKQGLDLLGIGVVARM